MCALNDPPHLYTKEEDVPADTLFRQIWEYLGVLAVVVYEMNNSVRVTQKHYLQITDDHHLAGCGITPESKAVSPAVPAASFIPIHAPSAKTPTLENKAFPVIDRHGPSVGIPQVGDEGLERFSYYSIKHEFLDQPSKQVVAQVVANPTLSETVALLIESWDDLCPEERTLLTALLSLNTSNVSQQR